jgi:membrane associated rhomboid family serine protease
MKLSKLSKYFYTEGKAKLTYAMMGISCFVFLFEVYLSLNGTMYLEKFLSDFGFSISNILKGRIWVFVTSIFLHASPEHLILNLIALFFFGKVVEIELGWKKFLLIFFSASFLGDLGIIITTLLGYGSATIATIGISGAVFGLLGAAMLIKPFELVFYPYLIPIPLVMVALLYTLFNIAAFVLVISSGMESDISYISHIGGLAAGLFFGFKEEGRTKSLITLLVILLLLIGIPLFYFVFQYLEMTNYTRLISQISR